MPKGSDEKFVSKLNQIFDENAATKSLYFVRQRRSPMDFSVRHFAGDVTYNAKVCVFVCVRVLTSACVCLRTGWVYCLLLSANSCSSGAAVFTVKWLCWLFRLIPHTITLTRAF